MEELVKQYPHCLFWVDVMQKDNDWKGIRFKKLNVDYKNFILQPNLFNEVDLEEFLKSEQKRLPLFIGSQFGISPPLESVFSNNNEIKIIAILSKSLLSGVVAGLKIYSVLNYELKEIAFFKNVK